MQLADGEAASLSSQAPCLRIGIQTVRTGRQTISVVGAELLRLPRLSRISTSQVGAELLRRHRLSRIPFAPERRRDPRPQPVGPCQTSGNDPAKKASFSTLHR